MFNRIKTVALAASAFALSALPVLAEGETQTPAYTQTITDVKDALTQFLTDMKTPMGAIIVAGLAIWLIPQVVRLLKRAFSTGKGR